MLQKILSGLKKSEYFLKVEIPGIFGLETLGSWNIPGYHVPRKSRSWEIRSRYVQIHYPKVQDSKTPELLISIHLIISKLRSYPFDRISYHIFKKEEMTTEIFQDISKILLWISYIMTNILHSSRWFCLNLNERTKGFMLRISESKCNKYLIFKI